MATTADRSEPKEMPEAQGSPEKQVPPHHSVDRFADARRAKKCWELGFKSDSGLSFGTSLAQT